MNDPILERALKVAKRKYAMIGDVNEALEHAERFLKKCGQDHTFGVESVGSQDYSLEYLNTGDTYGLTICFSDGEFFLSSSGDWLEETEKTILEDDGLIRCAYCGEFTEHNRGKATVCESCSRFVDGQEFDKQDFIDRVGDHFEDYLDCALWSSTDEDGNPLDVNYDVLDINKDTLIPLGIEYFDFVKAVREVFPDIKIDARFAQDFWLTRCGHGSGYWDGDYPEDQGKKLTEMSKPYGTVDLYDMGDEIYS